MSWILLFLCVLASFYRDKGLWIVKPVASSRGRGIYLINHVTEMIGNKLIIFAHSLMLFIAVPSTFW